MSLSFYTRELILKIWATLNTPSIQKDLKAILNYCSHFLIQATKYFNLFISGVFMMHALLVLMTLEHTKVKHLAYRRGCRWEKTFMAFDLSLAQLSTKQTQFKNRGVYLITGGLGGIGLSIAEQLTKTASVHLALISRSVIPQPEAWEDWLAKNTKKHPNYTVIEKLFLLKTQGASLSIWSADSASYPQMLRVVNSIE